MNIESSAFAHMQTLPTSYTCDGDEINPPLHISDIPKHTQSLVLIMDDPDIPPEIKEQFGIQVFTHWILYNIPPSTTHIDEGSMAGMIGKNSRDIPAYRGACPPPQYEPTTHRYFFRLYALDTMLDIKDHPTREEIETAMHAHIINTAELIATYDRSKTVL